MLQAQTPILSLEDCIDRAMERNFELRMRNEDINVAKAGLEIARKSRLPQLKAGASYLRFSEVMSVNISEQMSGLPLDLPPVQLRFGDEDNYTLNMSLVQPIFTGFRLNNQIISAKSALLAEEAVKEADINQLVYEIKKNYYNYISAVHRKRIAELSLKSVISHLEDVGNFYDQGLTTYNDVLKTKIRKSEMELMISRADNQKFLLKKALMHMLGMPLTDSLSIETNLEYRKPDIGLDDAIDEALVARPELTSTASTKNALCAAIRSAQAEFYPSISLVGGYEYGKPGLNKLENEWMDYWTVGISAQWHLWDWGIRDEKVQQSRAMVSRIEHSESLLLESIRLDVHQAYRKMTEYDSQVRLHKIIREQAEENFRILSDKFNQGLATNTDYLDAETQLTKAKLDEIISLAQHCIAVAGLERSMGRNNRRNL
jgi:outer membrane protein TolC